MQLLFRQNGGHRVEKTGGEKCFDVEETSAGRRRRRKEGGEQECQKTAPGAGRASRIPSTHTTASAVPTRPPFG